MAEHNDIAEYNVSQQDAAAVVASLDLATKVKLLSGHGFWALEALPEHDIRAITVSDGPHGLRSQISTADHLGLTAALPATCFPTAVTLGSSWDTDLLNSVGSAIGEEALALGVSVVLGPGINIKRHPAGGRCFEYLSEDPILSGLLAAAMVHGVQAHGVGTSLKHFAVNNQESHRLVVDAVLDERTLREVYLRGFEIVVTEAQPWTVMCSYNKVNGIYASEHTELLSTILRDEWGFDGLVVSDWGAVNDRAHGVAAGMDLEMPGSRGANDPAIIEAVRSGALDESAVDACAVRVVELLQRGQTARSTNRSSVPEVSEEDRDTHHALARRAAAAGTVLLANNGVLPLRVDRHIAVVGAFAVEPRYQGAGSSQVNPTKLDRPLDALRERVGSAGRVTYTQGFDIHGGTSPRDGLGTAIGAARDADVVVVFAGLPAAQESEGFDRKSLDLPPEQVELIEALTATTTPVVVVLNNGGVVHMGWADRVDGVLECWLGGQAGGAAVVDVLMGDADPGGRLAQSIPAHVAQLPAHLNFPGAARQVEYREGLYVGYRFHDTAGVPARFAFGHGMSYTTFEWSDITLSGSGTDPEVRTTVTNSGIRPGSDVVQVYVRAVSPNVHRPDKELAGFAKVHLDAGESQEVVVALRRRSFAIWDVSAHDWLVEAGPYELIVARSSVDPVEVLHVEIESRDELGAALRPVGFVATDEEFAGMLGRPIPTPTPSQPFTRNSTLEEMASTRLGRTLASLVTREALKRSAAEFPDPDDATLEMIRASVLEAPARSLVLMSGGAIGFEQLDTVIDALNGNWKSLGVDAWNRIRDAFNAGPE